MCTLYNKYYIGGLVQDRRYFIANALELRLFFALIHRYKAGYQVFTFA